MAEKDDIMSTIRDEALPLGEALKKFGDGAFQVAFDLYDFGIVFFRPELQRQHYVVNYLHD